MYTPLYILAIMALWWWGGSRQSWARDVLVPIITGLALFFHHYPWWICLLTIGSCNIIRLGYGSYDPEHDSKPSLLASLTHDRSGIGERAVYGFICGMVAPICLIVWGLTHGQPVILLKMLGYALTFASLGAAGAYIDRIFSWQRLPIDLIIGLGFASILIWF